VRPDPGGTSWGAADGTHVRLTSGRKTTRGSQQALDRVTARE
jgi:hypothetical protein